MKTANNKISLPVLLSLIAAFCLIAGNGLYAAERSLVRDSIPDRYKWDLSKIYPDWQTWEKDLARSKSDIDQFAALEGSLKSGPEKLLHALRKRDKINILLRRLGQYAGLQRSADLRNNEINAERQKVGNLGSKFRSISSWLDPELLSIPWDTVDSWIKTTPGLEPYRMELENKFRQLKHYLDPGQERLLSYFSKVNSVPNDIYSSLSTADMKYPDIKLPDGEDRTLTYGRYINLLTTNRDQAVRAEAFDSTMRSYADNKNTYASIYNGVLQKDWAVAQARNYNSTLEYYLDDDNIPPEVFTNLVEGIKNRSEAVRRYFKLKEKVLGIKNYHMYDRFVPLVDFHKEYDYDTVVNWVVESVAPLGKDYQDKMKEALHRRYIDVYENEGKYTGAFSSSAYGLHPYVLMNFNGTLRSVFTLAHEMGHSLHSILSQENQPYPTAGYSIFVAEVASTFNEQLLVNYLLDRITDPHERIVLLQHAIDDLVGTFYRQIVFADFEWEAHQLAEKGEPITADILYSLYMDVTEDYYGDSMQPDSLLGYYWTSIPHFYFGPYYVYKYATSFTASSEIMREITESNENNRTKVIEKYLGLLKSGGSDYPIDELKKAGVDMTDPDVFYGITDLTDKLVTQLEDELNKLDN